MLSEIALQLKHITKKYHLYDHPFDRVKEAFHPLRHQYHRDFYALQDVSLTIRQGETLGLVGKNGSGKSTLLQIICGVLTPTTGSLEVRGSISALLELSAGFNPELTGMENVFFKSSLLGYSHAQTVAKLDEILSFADIGEFIDQPVKTYSSGMFVRLAFAVAVNVDPDILIIDEALSVGDYRFRQKCLRKINAFREAGKTIIFVSHDTFAINAFCSRAVWLKDGVIHSDGSPDDITRQYLSYMSEDEISLTTKEDQQKPSPSTLRNSTELCISELASKPDNDEKLEWTETQSCESYGNGDVTIRRISLHTSGSHHQIISFKGGERVMLSLEIDVHKDVNSPIVGFHLLDEKGIHVLGINTAAINIPLGPFKKGERKILSMEFDFPYLKVGTYAISPALASGTVDEYIQHHWVHQAYILKISSADPSAWLGHYLVIKDNVSITLS